MIYWFFGYPGIGKDYCAKYLSEVKKFPYIDADDFLTDEDRQKLLKKIFTIEDRLLKLERIITHIKILQKHHENITVADSLPDNASRNLVKNAFPGKIKLILVTAPTEVHKKRIAKRKNHFFTSELLEDYIKRHWKKINVTYMQFENTNSDDWKERLLKLL
jgi:gluconate kinase